MKIGILWFTLCIGILWFTLCIVAIINIRILISMDATLNSIEFLLKEIINQWMLY